MSGKPSTILVVPCYNEAGRLSVEPYLQAVDERPHLRLVLVDDGSTDETWPMLNQLAALRPDAIVTYQLASNQGKAEAVRQGLLYAHTLPAPADGGAVWFGFWDADLATPLDQLDLMLPYTLESSCKIILGARVRLMGRQIRRRPQRHVFGRLFATCASLALNLPVYDTQCGAKLVAADVLEELFGEPFTTRWLFDVEMLARFVAARSADQARLAIREVPLNCWEDVSGSRLKTSDFLRAPAELVQVWRQYLR